MAQIHYHGKALLRTLVESAFIETKQNIHQIRKQRHNQPAFRTQFDATCSPEMCIRDRLVTSLIISKSRVKRQCYHSSRKDLHKKTEKCKTICIVMVSEVRADEPTR